MSKLYDCLIHKNLYFKQLFLRNCCFKKKKVINNLHIFIITFNKTPEHYFNFLIIARRGDRVG